MPEERDEYGGVAIDAAPQVDEYGGQLVPERTMLPEVPRVPEEAGARIMGAGEPLLTLPRLEATDPRFQAFLTGLTGRPPSMRAAENVAAAANVAKTLPEFLTSPLGAATAPIAAAGGLPARLLGLGFAGQMAAGVPEAAREAGMVSVEGTPQEQKEALLGLGVNIALPAALAAPALARRGLVRPAPEEIRPSPTPVAPEAAAIAPAPAPTPLTAAEQAAERARLASELGEEPEPTAPAPVPAPEPAPVPEAPVEVAAPAKPEVANLGDPSTKPNRFGDPAGTTYYATPKDWQAWQEHDARFKKISKDFIEAMRGGDPEKIAEAQKAQLEVGKEHEAFREKYGGMNPEPPKVATVEASATEQLSRAFKSWDEGTDPNLTERDLLDRTELAIENNPGDIPSALKKAAQAYRDAIEEDFEMAGRGDVEPSQERFMSQLEKFSTKTAPTTYTGSDAIEIVGKPLGEWFKAKTVAELPKGAQRVELAGRIRAKSTKPKDILGALKNEQDRIRRVVTEMAKPPLSPEEAIPMVQPTPVPPTATETTPPVPAAEMPKTPTSTPPTETPPQAAARAQGEVSKVASTEGQRPAKEVKAELVSKLEQSIEDAPTEEEAYKSAIERAGATVSLNAEKYEKQKADIRKGNQIPKVTIEIPRDGTFTVLNTKEALGQVLERAKRLSTAPGAPVKVARRTVSKEQAQEFLKEAEQPPRGPGPIGMGGAAAGEIQATGPRGEPTHGIAARVLEQRRQQGVIAPVEPGEGISPQESIERGRQLLARGVDPEKVLGDFNLTKAVSAEGIAVVRAQGERLARTAYAMADAHGIHSPEYEAAWEADSDWAKRTKPMQTEWHKIGQAQQGETEIDTGTFHGLRKAFLDATGKDFTPKQAKEAEGIAKGVKEATEAADKAKADVFAEVGKQARTTPETKPDAPKPGEIATPDATTLWKRAKAMIDAGEDDFDALRHKLATEFGVPVEEVTRKLAEPKSARKITDDMYRKMAEQRRMVSQAKGWLKNQQVPGWLRFMRSVPRIFFTAKILGHGTVGMITHAGLNIFNPITWRTYWPNFFKQYRLVASKAYHERMMQDLLHDPLFTKARRAGLANDPFRFQDDYQTPTLIKWLDRIGITGNRGFDALKLFRQARFNQIWNSLPDTLQTPEYAKLLADSVNHSTGVIRRPFREWSNWTFFAPRLEASRWAWMVKDPWDAAKTFVDWNKASPAEKAFAMSQLKEKAVIAGTYYSLLMMNQGLLSASGSDQRINFDNPRRGDFLAFKAAGHNIGIVGPMLGMVRLFANLYHAAAGKRGKVEALTPRAAEFGQIGFEYARGKLSPFAGFGVDVVSQADFQGRPMPYSNDAVPKYLRRQGLDRYTYGEYAAQEFTPIPVSEAVREVWHDQGMGDDEINAWLKALTVGVAAGSTGARVSAETPPSTAK